MPFLAVLFLQLRWRQEWRHRPSDWRIDNFFTWVVPHRTCPSMKIHNFLTFGSCPNGRAPRTSLFIPGRDPRPSWPLNFYFRRDPWTFLWPWPLNFYFRRDPWTLFWPWPFIFTLVVTLEHSWFIPLVVTLMFYTVDVTLDNSLIIPLVVTLKYWLWTWPLNIPGLSLWS